MLPTIQTDGKLTTVFIGNTTLWFSYKTLVAFRIGAEKCVSENCWSNTTGKHLNTIDGGNKERRMKRADFERRYAIATAELTAKPEISGILG